MAIAKPTEVVRFASLRPWAATTAYVIGEYVTNDSGKVYLCDTDGISAGSGGPTGTSANIVDGTTRWDYSAASGTTALVVAPSTTQLHAGWGVGQKPPAQYFNWFMFSAYRWFLYLRDIEAYAHTWTDTNTFNGASGDTNAALATTSTPSTRKLLWRIALGGSVFARMYSVDAGRAWELTLNAAWDGSEWDIDAAGGAVFPTKIQLRATSAGNLLIFRHDGVISFGDGAWDHQAIVNILTSGLGLTGAFTASTTITAGTGLTITSGDGLASSGSLRAEGTVAGESGPGLVKARRFYSTGTAVVGGDFTIGGGWGVGASITATSGDDTAGEVTVQAAGTPAADPTLTLTYKDGTFTGTPISIAAQRGSSTAGDLAPVTWGNSATALAIVWRGTPTAGRSYSFSWHTIGR